MNASWLARLLLHHVVALLAFALGVGIAQGQPNKGTVVTPPAKEYAQVYVQSFKGANRDDPAWQVVNPGADQNLRFEADGLRITLPSGWGGERPPTGVHTRFGVKGDFEITLSFEIFKEPEPADAGTRGGTRLNLGVVKEGAKGDITTTGRLIHPTNGRRFIGWASLWDDKAGKPLPYSSSVPTKGMMGRIRLVRSGADIYYGRAEGFERDLGYFREFAFGAEDVQQVRVVAATGGEKASFAARAFDLRIRADSIPNMPAAAVVPAPMPAVGQDGAGPGPAPAAGRDDAEAAPAPKGWLMAALLIGAGFVFLFVLSLLTGFLLLRRRGGQASSANLKNKR